MSTYKLNRTFTICALLIATALPTLGQSTDGGIEPFIKMRWPGGATLSPDQTLYYTFNPEGIRQLYKVPAGKTQKDAIKLTTFEDGIGGYSLSDDGREVGQEAGPRCGLGGETAGRVAVTGGAGGKGHDQDGVLIAVDGAGDQSQGVA